MSFIAATPWIGTVLLATMSSGLSTAHPVAAQEPQERPSVESHRLVLDSSASVIKFELGATFHTVHGRARLLRGEISWEPEAGTCSGTLVIDATSLDTAKKGRDKKMHGAVLESDTFKTIEFACHSFKGDLDANGYPDSELIVTGDFLIHGDTHRVSVPLMFATKDGWWSASGRLSVPYVEWGMKDPSTVILRVAKTVDVILELKARPLD